VKDTILKALNWRYAGQIFDLTKIISEEELHTILEAGRLSPSSFGIEAWKFIVVENKEIRTKLRGAAYDQPKVTDASKLIVIARRTDARQNISQEKVSRVEKIVGKKTEELDSLKKMIDGSIAGRSDAELDAWIQAQAYIPLGIMIETAALLGVDSGPMEGFSQDQVDEILGLKEKNLRSTVMLALGHRGQDPSAERKKIRRDFNEVVEVIK